MPRRKNVPRRESHRELTPLGDLAILEEDKRYLEMRVARLDTGMAWAEDPASRTRHLIGNLEAAPLENGEVEANPYSHREPIKAVTLLKAVIGQSMPPPVCPGACRGGCIETLVYLP
jgi:hypothetical protein